MTRRFAALSLNILLATAATAASADDTACGTLEGADAGSGAFSLNEGEAVDLISAGKRVRGTLHVYRDDAVFRIYWQPDGSPENYVLANAGTDSIRLIATPPRGSPVAEGPGMMPKQQVLSCPSL
ncbi:hypothetical protein AWB67_02612 [Caballeronia terrestris]|uniref:Uncharacterized protein n=1 Tax=Caballeronia terrestris TaxID=1226301 RepID=A0A158IKX0_9BURK|nr:hypothetical protein [Caballeronia terrestris]SAL57137.1 hypothetical protein AWB67_02612 [Caballeronia terrestris]